MRSEKGALEVGKEMGGQNEKKNNGLSASVPFLFPPPGVLARLYFSFPPFSAFSCPTAHAPQAYTNFYFFLLVFISFS